MNLAENLLELCELKCSELLARHRFGSFMEEGHKLHQQQIFSTFLNTESTFPFP
jgi:hypothetical protein